MSRLRAALLLVVVAALAGCGSTTRVREPDLVASGQATTPSTPAPGTVADRDAEAIRIAVVTHGGASSSFWAIVRNGIDAGARQMDVLVNYRSPDVYSVARMRELIDSAVAAKPDGLVVSIPSPGLAGAIRRARAAGIPVVSINSGANLYKRLGILAHVGQPESRAGFAAGRRLAAAGVRRALCLNAELGNEALEQRCRAFARALRAGGGTARQFHVDVNDPGTPRRIAAAMTAGRIDGVLSLNNTGGIEAVEAVRLARRAGRVKIGTFDLSPEVLAAVRAGQIGFAIDQQAYLQGYLPIVLLAQRVRYGLFPAQGDVIPTGPSFVTKGTAAKVIRLSRRSIR